MPAAADSIGTELQLCPVHRPPCPSRCCSHWLKRLQERFHPTKLSSCALLLHRRSAQQMNPKTKAIQQAAASGVMEGAEVRRVMEGIQCREKGKMLEYV